MFVNFDNCTCFFISITYFRPQAQIRLGTQKCPTQHNVVCVSVIKGAFPHFFFIISHINRGVNIVSSGAVKGVCGNLGEMLITCINNKLI